MANIPDPELLKLPRSLRPGNQADVQILRKLTEISEKLGHLCESVAGLYELVQPDPPAVTKDE